MEPSTFTLFCHLFDPSQNVEARLQEQGVTTIDDVKLLSDQDVKDFQFNLGTRNRLLRAIAILKGEVHNFVQQAERSIDDDDPEWQETIENLFLKKKKEVIEEQKKQVEVQVTAYLGGTAIKAYKEVATTVQTLKSMSDPLLRSIVKREIANGKYLYTMECWKSGVKGSLYITAAVALFEVGDAIYEFYNGAITGKACAQRITHSLATGLGSFGGSLAGALAGAKAGGMFGPVGLLIGATVGTIIGGLGGHFLGSYANTKAWDFFEKGKTDEEARKQMTKDAFKLFEADFNNPPAFHVISRYYKRQILTCHPDKISAELPDEDRAILLKKFIDLTSAYKILQKFYEKKLTVDDMQEIRQITAIEFN